MEEVVSVLTNKKESRAKPAKILQNKRNFFY